MTAEIKRLAWRATPRISYAELDLLQRSLGRAAGRAVIARAVCDLSGRLDRLRRALADGDPDRVQRIALRMIAVSDQIGLVEFSAVAADLVRCLDGGDAAATGAVAARLLRLGDRSMFEVAQFAEVTGG